MQLCILNSHRLAMLGVTWDGHRLALQIVKNEEQ